MLNKNRLLLSAFLLSFLCGCTTVKYSGPTYTPTKKVDIFYSKKQIKKPYTTMGTATLSTWYTYQNRRIRSAMISKAKEVGADAILVNSIDAEPTKPARRDSAATINSSELTGVNSESGIHPGQRVFAYEEGHTESMNVSSVSVDFLKYNK